MSDIRKKVEMKIIERLKEKPEEKEALISAGLKNVGEVGNVWTLFYASLLHDTEEDDRYDMQIRRKLGDNYEIAVRVFKKGDEEQAISYSQLFA